MGVTVGFFAVMSKPRNAAAVIEAIATARMPTMMSPRRVSLDLGLDCFMMNQIGCSGV